MDLRTNKEKLKQLLDEMGCTKQKSLELLNEVFMELVSEDL